MKSPHNFCFPLQHFPILVLHNLSSFDASIIDLNSLGLELKQHIEILAVKAPIKRSSGVKVGSVQELVDKLKNEAKLL